MPSERSVVLAQPRLELAPMIAAGIALRSVHAAAVPGQPHSGLGVDVLAVTEVEQLSLERDAGLRIRLCPADLAPEDKGDRHPLTVARRSAQAPLANPGDSRW
jgi:hypothetical protein